MKFIAILAFMSLSAFAGSYSGSFVAQEVDKNQTPLYSLEIDYSIQVKGDEDIMPVISETKFIQHGYSAHTFLKTFFAKSDTDFLVYATKTKLDAVSFVESSIGQGKKGFRLQSEWLVLDQKKVNTAFEQTILVNNDELHFDGMLSNLPLIVTVCVGQDRPVLRSVKPLGCQDISSDEWKSGSVILREINWKEANPQRYHVYFFNWRIDGMWLSGTKTDSPYIEN